MDLAEWTWFDWLLQQSDYRCSITVNCPITRLVKSKAANPPIMFEEIVMVMINNMFLSFCRFTVPLRCVWCGKNPHFDRYYKKLVRLRALDFQIRFEDLRLRPTSMRAFRKHEEGHQIADDGP